MIVIASGKGGVGKTWFSISLAQALARRGRRVLLADADLGLANIDVQLGIQPERDLTAVLSGKMTPVEAATRIQDAGFAVLAGRSGSGALASLSPAALEAFLLALGAARQHWQDVVVDLGAGIDVAQRRIAAAADLLLVVATEEPTSLTDAYAVLKLHGMDNPKGISRIVVNMAEDRASGQRTYETLRRAAGAFLKREIPLAGVVRRDAKVRDAIRHQTPLRTRHPRAAAATDSEASAQARM
ncbi:MAG: P-loop NTPase [Alphaproteobacteria bacterium]